LPVSLTGWLALLFFGSLWFFGQRTVMTLSDCVKGPLKRLIRCEGDSGAGWMNSAKFYVIGQGEPDRALCAQLLAGKDRAEKKPECDLRKTGDWLAGPCLPELPGMQCLFCDRGSRNGNTHFYKMIALSPDCSRGVFFSGSGYRPQDWSTHLAWRE